MRLIRHGEGVANFFPRRTRSFPIAVVRFDVVTVGQKYRDNAAAFPTVAWTVAINSSSGAPRFVASR